MENLRKQLEDLQLILYNKDSEIQQLKEAAKETSGETIEQSDGAAEKEAEVKLGLNMCMYGIQYLLVINEQNLDIIF